MHRTLNALHVEGWGGVLIYLAVCVRCVCTQALRMQRHTMLSSVGLQPRSLVDASTTDPQP